MTAPRRAADFPALNGARAIAAYAVVMTHDGFTTGRSLGHQPFAGLIARFDFGVTLFFLLSGFLLSRQFLVDPGRLTGRGIRSFWRRRLLRILPAYWLAVAVTLGALSSVHVRATDWLSYLLMVQTYDHHATNPSLSQMWTLSVELTFYFVLPCLLLAARRLPVRPRLRVAVLLVAMVAVALGSELAVHIAVGPGSQAMLWLPLYLDWFALGILLAALTVPGTLPAGWTDAPRRWATSPGACWTAGLLLLWLATLPLAGPRNLVPATTWEWTVKHLLYGAAAFLLLLPLVASGSARVERGLGNPVSTWLGEVSYGVYLWHLGLLLAFQRWIGWPVFGGHFWSLLVITVIAATAVAGLSWHLYERPILRRWSSSWRRTAPDRTARSVEPVAAG